MPVIVYKENKDDDDDGRKAAVQPGHRNNCVNE
jgi:hypothetical protein